MSETEGKVVELGPRFRLVPFDRITVGAERVYLVKGIIPAAGLVVVWGPPKCGKSFWTFDLVMHVALGWKYRGRHSRFAAGAAKQAMHHCGLDDGKFDPTRFGVYLGSGEGQQDFFSFSRMMAHALEGETLDVAAQATYVPAVLAAQKAAGGHPFNTGGGRIVAMEGAAAPKRVAITEWDSLEQAQAFYNSKAWKDLEPQRNKAAKTIRRYSVEAAN